MKKRFKAYRIIPDGEWEFNQRVKINQPNHFMHEMTGTVIGNDGYTVEIRMDKVTKEMEGFGDTKRGIINCEPEKLTKIN